MPDGDFGSLGERLLRAGVAPAQVRRLLAELTTHYALLVDEETGRGQPVELARTRARIRLGTDDDIVARAREQAALRSWGARWPLVVCGFAPLMALAGSALLLLASLVAVLALSGPVNDPGIWFRRGTQLAGWALMYGLPLVWAYLLARYTLTRRLQWRWPVTGLILTAAAGAATNFSVVWPHPGAQGQLTAGVGWSSDHGLVFAARGLATFAAGLALYFLARARLKPRVIA